MAKTLGINHVAFVVKDLEESVWLTIKSGDTENHNGYTGAFGDAPAV